jgi:hypothetical protein
METCEMFPLFGLRNALRVWQDNYCEGEYVTCARYKAANNCEEVPANLLPNGKMLLVDMDLLGKRR